MKILYVSSCHPVLEFDDLTILTELGHDWFSTGIYLNPNKLVVPQFNWRKSFDKEANTSLISQFLSFNPRYKFWNKVVLRKQFVDQFDLVWVNHCSPYPFFIKDNWGVLKTKPCVWRTYGHQLPNLENMTKTWKKEGLTIVRTYETETLQSYSCESDYIIGPYVDKEEYKEWKGTENHILTFNNHFKGREYDSNTNLYLKVREKFNCKLYGQFNSNVPYSLGTLSWEDQKEEYRKARVYFSLGTKPAPITYNFIEALMTGTPIVTFGNKLGRDRDSEKAKRYIVPDLIENGINGYCCDSLQEIENCISSLLNNKNLCESISLEARKTAIKFFDKDKAKTKWKEVIESIT